MKIMPASIIMLSLSTDRASDVYRLSGAWRAHRPRYDKNVLEQGTR
jgi:hypothetical protein